MKTTALLSVIVTASSLFFGGIANAHTSRGSSAAFAANAESPLHVTLIGYVHQGQFRNPGSSKPIPYLYLELDKPVGKYVHDLKPSERKYREVELVGGSSATIHKLEALVGKKATVRGELPFTFDANAPAVVLPLVMLMDGSQPQLFK